MVVTIVYIIGCLCEPGAKVNVFFIIEGQGHGWLVTGGVGSDFGQEWDGQGLRVAGLRGGRDARCQRYREWGVGGRRHGRMMSEEKQ